MGLLARQTFRYNLLIPSLLITHQALNIIWEFRDTIVYNTGASNLRTIFLLPLPMLVVDTIIIASTWRPCTQCWMSRSIECYSAVE